MKRTLDQISPAELWRRARASMTDAAVYRAIRKATGWTATLAWERTTFNRDLPVPGIDPVARWKQMGWL